MDTRNSDENTQQRELIIKLLSRVNTHMPGIIKSFDDATQTATVQPAIMMKTVVDGEEGHLEYADLINVPVAFPFGSVAGFAMTVPINKDDPCTINFVQGPIDAWHELGGVQPPETGVERTRSHSITDAIITLGPSDLGGVLGGWETDGIQLRNRAKTTTLTVRNTEAVLLSGTSVLTLNSTGEAELTATTSVAITTPEATIDADDTYVTGNLEVGGNIIGLGNVSDSVRSMADDRTIYNSHDHYITVLGGSTEKTDETQ